MPVALNINQATRVATVTTTLDITQILADTQAIADPAQRTLQRRLLIGAAAMQEIGKARKAIRQTDADLDAQVTALQAEVAAIKAARPA